jgi:hypothetical protein
MARRKDHFHAFSICPHCNKPARVRRNGQIKFHRVPVWDEETQTGRFARCPGVGKMNNVQCAWLTLEDAEKGLAALRGTLKPQSEPMPEPEEKPAPGDCEAVMDAAFDREFFEEPKNEATTADRPKLWIPGMR